MAEPAKLEFNSWIETIRKHIEQAEHSYHTSRSNSLGGKRKPSAESSSAQAALQSLNSLHDELLQQASGRKSGTAGEAASPFAFNDLLAQDFATQIAGPVASQVASTLSAQLSLQLSDQISKLFENSFTQLRVVDSNASKNSEDLGEDGPAAELRPKLANRIDALELELADLQANSQASEVQLRRSADESESRSAALQDELGAAYETIAELQTKLVDANHSVWSLDRRHESQTDENLVIAELEAEIASLQVALAAVRTDCWQVAEKQTGGDVGKMAAEIADLKQQNSDLASQLARAQMSSHHNPPHLNMSALNQESMTWEQRKKLILQQLENESAAENQTEHSQHRIEIEDVLRTTQSEIELRDKEIAELKSIVEQQSNTREGVAIGAAAIAQMLDSDELVKLEREKLVAIQREWEGKLRDAEIQISMERATLSRERAELETQIRRSLETTANLQLPSTPIEDTKPDGKPVRRWLEHLGLRDK